jgi:UDP-N-acetylmuramoyl-tripeptide--D-alanyl-D-alanine ligase
MVTLNIFVPLFYFFLLFLLLQIIKFTVFFIYLVQTKEYRIDRLKVHFQTRTGKDQIINYFNLLKWRKIFRPKFTFRALLILGLTLFGQYNFFFFTLRFAFKIFRGFQTSTIFLLVITIFLVNLITPFLILFSAGFTYLILFPIRKIIVFLATKKIEDTKDLLVIGVTGSYGKTAVKEIVSFILGGFFKTFYTPFNCNTQLGVASLILKKLRKSHEVFVVEMGAYKKGEIREICQMVKPKIGIITGINEQHLALFGSIKNTQWAKYELIKSLPADGLAIFNANDHYCSRLAKATKKAKVLYGKKRIRFKTKLVGRWHQENIQAALAVADFLGLGKRKVFSRLAKIKEPALALTIKKGINGSKIIDDSYSANPAGFLAALDLLKKTPGSKKILVTPGIIELGKAGDKIHQQIGQKAKNICSKIFLTKPDFREAIEKGLGKERAEQILEVEKDADLLLDKLEKMLKRRTVVLLEGVPPYFVKKLSQ